LQAFFGFIFIRRVKDSSHIFDMSERFNVFCVLFMGL
jgi:hypothetical protein